MKMNNLYYWIRNFLFHRYDLIRTKLNPCNWHDTDIKILYGMMNLVVEFVEKENGIADEYWNNYNIDVQSEIKTIYCWWSDYEYRLNKIDEKLRVISEERVDKNDILGLDLTSKGKKISAEYHKMIKQLEKEEQDMLIRLIKIRKYLWT